MQARLSFSSITLAASLTACVIAAGAALEQRTFATPRQAARALLTAAEGTDLPALKNIFGPGADDVLNSGDPVEDKNNRAQFVKKARQSMKIRLGPGAATRATLSIGADAFPFPIPLVRTDGRWRFATQAGRREILARRIGSNELDAIAACRAYVDAQYDYASEDRNHNGVPEYARKLISSPGKRDGLFWPGADAPPTQLTSDIKKAQAEGYQKGTPYHGYYYRILLAQGQKARGGALDYVQHGEMIGGFALLAWPAEHDKSGVKSFLVNQDGVVYEKDLGEATATVAENITKFNPDPSWRKVK